MAEYGTDPETGKRYVREEGGQWMPLPSTAGEAAGRGAAQSMLDVMLLPSLPLQGLGAGLEALGAEEAGQALQRAGTGLREQREALRSPADIGAELGYPMSYFGGQVGGAIMPGRAPIQIGTAALIEGGRGETFEEQIAGAMIGGTLAGTMEGAGRYLQRRTSQMRQRTMGEQQADRAVAAQRLEDLGVNLPERAFAREGASAAATRDRLGQLLDPGASLLAKRHSVNEIFTDTLLPGRGANAITPRFKTDHSKYINAEYDAIEADMPAVLAKSEEADQTLIEMMALADTVTPDARPTVDEFTDRIVRAYDAGQLTPEWWSGMRSNLNTAARNADSKGSRDLMYSLRHKLDDLMMTGSPELAQRLADVNEHWRIREVYRVSGVVNPERHLNPTAFVRGMRRMFGHLDDETVQAPEMARFLYNLADDLSLFPEFATSGTGEMLTASSASRQLSARIQRQAGTLGGITGGSTGRAMAKTADTLKQAAERVISAVTDAFDDEEEQDQ